MKELPALSLNSLAPALAVKTYKKWINRKFEWIKMTLKSKVSTGSIKYKWNVANVMSQWLALFCYLVIE